MHLWLFAAATAQTFNLACTGTLTSDDFYRGQKAEPYSYVYRLNLDTRQWCEGECKELHSIQDVQPAKLILTIKRVDAPSEDSVSTVVIDRETGRHFILMTHKNPRNRYDISIRKWEGQCERKPFTGFPKVETKF